MKLRKGFTLAEIVMVFLVITIIMGTLLSIWRPKQVVRDKTVKYMYSNTLSALDDALSEVVEYPENNPYCPFPEEEFACRYPTDENKFEGFCKLLSDQINLDSSFPVRCNIANAFDIKNDSDVKGFGNYTPNFVAVNGVKFYISKYFERNVAEEGQEENIIRFFIIYADIIGGDDRYTPTLRSLEYNPGTKRHPEVFAFAALDTGGLLPLGIPEVNARYLQTYIEYAADGSLRHSKVYTYAEAKNKAWGLYRTGEPVSLYLPNVPYTANDVIRNILMSETAGKTLIYKNVPWPPAFGSAGAAGQLTPCLENSVATSYARCTIWYDVFR